MTDDMTNQPATVSELVNRDAVDPAGDKIGKIFDVYVDNDTGQPEWLAISTGLFGTKVSFAPLADASLAGEGVRLPYTKDQVKDAPRADADGELSPEGEDALYAHYGRPTRGTATTTPTEQREAATRTTGDDAMTRFEEELDVSTTRRETGRARLRKWVETEDVQMTVPIRREKARMVTEPITGDNVDAAMSGPDLTEDEHEVVLSEEVVDVDTRRPEGAGAAGDRRRHRGGRRRRGGAQGAHRPGQRDAVNSRPPTTCRRARRRRHHP